jgi:deoxyribose-phosphate aldolase
VALARDALGGSGVKVVAVIGFPLGATTAGTKVDEAMGAVMDGADELDIVMNIGIAKEDRWGDVEKEIKAVVMATPRVVHKVIIETAYLEKEEIRLACEAAVSAGAEFVKTSTGFSPKGATVEDVRLIRDFLHGRAGIKAAGGIRDLKTALALTEAGADRLGTSSGGKIINELEG